jgi:hypothetical protein
MKYYTPESIIKFINIKPVIIDDAIPAGTFLKIAYDYAMSNPPFESEVEE